MERVYNFSPGPSALPLPVLEKAQRELVNTNDSGMSIMEMSHRSKMFLDIITEAEKLLRELMDIPDNYKVLFLQGGASTQFAMVPLNLFSGGRKADYANTGMWSKKAISEAKKYGTVNVVASSKVNGGRVSGPIWTKKNLPGMPTIFTLQPTIPFMAPGGPSCPIPATCP